MRSMVVRTSTLPVTQLRIDDMSSPDDFSSPSYKGSTTSAPDSSTSSGLSENKVAEDLAKVQDKAKHELDAVTQKAAEDVRALKDEAKAQLGSVAEKTRSFASDQKSLAASQLTGVADAISKVADELDQNDQGTISRYARDLAGSLSKAGEQIENRNVDEIMSMAQDFGRRQPLAFLGAAALAGFVASRFALASAHRTSNAPSGSNQGSSQSTGSSYGTGGSSQSGASSYGTGSGSSYSGGQQGTYRSEGSASAYGSSTTGYGNTNNGAE